MEVIVPIRMSPADFVLVFNLAQQERRSVEDFILNCISEKIQRIQQEWMARQQMTVKPEPEPEEKKEERRKGGGK